MLLGVMLFLQAQVGVHLDTSVRPETVTVGQHFVVTLRVRAPIGSEIRFPVAIDSVAAMDTVDATVRHDTTLASEIVSTMTYTLAAWNVGAQWTGVGDVVVQTPTGPFRQSMDALGVYVRSVLPKDTMQRVPKAPRPRLERRVVPRSYAGWIVALLAVFAVAAAGVMGARVMARRRRIMELDDDAFAWAEREFQRIEARQLIEAGEPKQHAIYMMGVVRELMVRVVPGMHLSATTRELEPIVRGVEAVPADHVIALFARADVLKFSVATVTAERARRNGEESRAVVREIAKRVNVGACGSYRGRDGRGQ